jgi:hypothetical protein
VSRLQAVLEAGRAHRQVKKTGWGGIEPHPRGHAPNPYPHGTPEHEEVQRQQIEAQRAYRAQVVASEKQGNRELLELLARMSMESLSLADQGPQGCMTVNLSQLAYVPRMRPGRYRFTAELAMALSKSAAHIVSYKLNLEPLTHGQAPYLMVNERDDIYEFTRGHMNGRDQERGWDQGWPPEGSGEASSNRGGAPRAVSRQPSDYSDDLYS